MRVLLHLLNSGEFIYVLLPLLLLSFVLFLPSLLTLLVLPHRHQRTLPSLDFLVVFGMGWDIFLRSPIFDL